MTIYEREGSVYARALPPVAYASERVTKTTSKSIVWQET